MKKRNKQQTYITISRILLIFSTILIVFSFFAPNLLTQPSEIWDFRNTGPIGDTIGGIMNPFIAIAGVISTFVAFLIQVQANKLQREQFMKSLNKNIIDDRIDSYNKLCLMKIDIDEIIKDINGRISYLDSYMSKIRENPYNYTALYRTTLRRYDRMASIERLAIYKGFQTFLDNDWIQMFNKLYVTLDYIPDAFNELYGIVKYHNDDIFNEKKKIKELCFSLEQGCASYLELERNTDIQMTIQSLLNEYQEFVLQKVKESYYLKLHEILRNYGDKIKIYGPSFPQKVENIYDIIIQILRIFNEIKQKTELQLLPELEKFKENISQKEDSPKYKLQQIGNAIQIALEKTSVKNLQQEYYN